MQLPTLNAHICISNTEYLYVFEMQISLFGSLMDMSEFETYIVDICILITDVCVSNADISI